MAEKVVKTIFFLLLIAAIAIFMSKIISKNADLREKTAYEKTLDKIAKLDEKHSMDIDDYKFGMDHLKYNPRFPKPLNPGDIPDVVAEFEKIKKGIPDDKPSLLLVDARMNLLEAERYYKLSKKFPLKGSVEDGFACSEIDAVTEAAGNLNMSVKYGRLVAEDLEELYINHKKEADMVDISRFWVKSVNESFTELADRARKNQNTINYFCLNSTTVDAKLEDEFFKAKEAQPGFLK